VWLFRKAFDPFLKSTKPVGDDTVPLTEAEVEAEARLAVTKDSTPEAMLPASMSASQDFEMIDSSSVRNEMSSNGTKKRAKKGRN